MEFNPFAAHLSIRGHYRWHGPSHLRVRHQSQNSSSISSFPFFWHLLLIISVFLADFLVGTEVLTVEVRVKIFGGSLQVEVVG